MALSVPPPSHTPWDRTLPNPAALMPTGAEVRRSSSLLQHHISSDQFTTPAADETGRGKHLPCIPPLNVLGKDRARAVDEEDGKQRQGSNISEDSMTDISSEDLSPVGNPTGYCLCVPEPKIPRPRNAFILYRQHHHAGVVSQHPGLPNPDISKIIGEQWRQLSPKDKNEWRALAEQEKARHSQQFPDYRYRPKRNGKYQSVDGSQAAASQPSTCAKCGGKTMNPPPTPHYPAYEHGAITPPVALSRAPKRGYVEAHGPPPPRQPSLVQVGPPAYSTPVHYGYGAVHRPRRESIHYVTQPPPPAPAPQQRMIVEDSEAKRRRLNASYPMRPAYEQQYYDRERPAYHRESVVRPMPPPPHRPSHATPPSAPPRGAPPSQRRDPSLTLPPLETGAQPRSIVSPTNVSPESRTETMIMSYPLLTKLKTLSSITPSLPAPKQSPPPHRARGMIIAVEGLDRRRVDDMTRSLSEQLGKESKFHVRTFYGPDPHSLASSVRRRSDGNGDNEAMSHAKYLNLMSEWHKMNEEIVGFVTHKQVESIETQYVDHEMTDAHANPRNGQKNEHPSQDPYERPGTRRSPISAVSPRTVDQQSAMALDTPVSASSNPRQFPEAVQSTSTRVTRSRVPQMVAGAHDESKSESRAQSPPPPPPPLLARPATPSPPHSPESIEENVSDLIPVALVPHYQLTTVDACSISLPITDNYDPLTHWRWHATLWRGCAGPDISVIIQSHTEEEFEISSIDGKKSSNQPPRNVGSANADPQARNSMNTASTPAPSAAATTASPPPHSAQAQTQTTTTTTNLPSSAPLPFSVDVRLQDHRAVIVRTRSIPSQSRVLPSSAAEQPDDRPTTTATAGADRENENWEKAKRRVGFEVEEWMRR